MEAVLILEQMELQGKGIMEVTIRVEILQVVVAVALVLSVATVHLPVMMSMVVPVALELGARYQARPSLIAAAGRQRRRRYPGAGGAGGGGSGERRRSRFSWHYGTGGGGGSGGERRLRHRHHPLSDWVCESVTSNAGDPYWNKSISVGNDNKGDAKTPADQSKFHHVNCAGDAQYDTAQAPTSATSSALFDVAEDS